MWVRVERVRELGVVSGGWEGVWGKVVGGCGFGGRWWGVFEERGGLRVNSHIWAVCMHQCEGWGF